MPAACQRNDEIFHFVLRLLERIQHRLQTWHTPIHIRFDTWLTTMAFDGKVHFQSQTGSQIFITWDFLVFKILRHSRVTSLVHIIRKSKQTTNIWGMLETKLVEGDRPITNQTLRGLCNMMYISPPIEQKAWARVAALALSLDFTSDRGGHKRHREKKLSQNRTLLCQLDLKQGWSASPFHLRPLLKRQWDAIEC